MSIKYRYRLFNRIAIIGSIILGTMIAYLNNRIEIKIILAWILLLMGSTILVLDYKKLKAIDRKFGVFKVHGENWLGEDGYWHDGYSEIISSRIQGYYDKGGEDLGYTFGRIIRMMTFVSGIGLGLIYLQDIISGGMYMYDEVRKYIFMVVFWTYIVIRKAVIG